VNLLVVAGILAALVGPLHGEPGRGVYRDLQAGPHVVYLVGHSADGFAPLYAAWRRGELALGHVAWYRGCRYRLDRIVGPIDRLAPDSVNWLLGGPAGTTSLRLQFCASPASSERVVILNFVRW
jgi:hypothetical protein